VKALLCRVPDLVAAGASAEAGYDFADRRSRRARGANAAHRRFPLGCLLTQCAEIRMSATLWTVIQSTMQK